MMEVGGVVHALLGAKEALRIVIFGLVILLLAKIAAGDIIGVSNM